MTKPCKHATGYVEAGNELGVEVEILNSSKIRSSVSSESDLSRFIVFFHTQQND